MDWSPLKLPALTRSATLENWTSSPLALSPPTLVVFALCLSVARTCWFAPVADERMPARLLSSMRIEAVPAWACAESGPPVNSIGSSRLYIRPCVAFSKDFFQICHRTGFRRARMASLNGLAARSLKGRRARRGFESISRRARGPGKRQPRHPHASRPIGNPPGGFPRCSRPIPSTAGCS